MTDWQCPVCGGRRWTTRWRVDSTATENGVDPDRFRPSADRYGETVGRVVSCVDCGHGSLRHTPTADELAAAYADAADPVSLEETGGQRDTALRSLTWIESVVSPGRLVDVGCWTGSLVAAAAERGWGAIGIEPSEWAVERAVGRGLDVRIGDLSRHGLPAGSFRAVVLGDVIEHLLDVRSAVTAAHDLLEPGGVLYLTTPDAGSRVAHWLGPRWWSVLPMHVQYFTRESMHRLLLDADFGDIAIRTHPKVFTASYYAERLAGYSPRAANAARAGLRAIRQDTRLVGPDFHDRMQVLAVRR